jgi:hypothetical protein
MSSLGGILEGGIVGLAVAEAAGTVVQPALEPSRQEANSKVRARIHELPELAQLVAQALLSREDVLEDVHRNGYPADALDSQIQLALRAPGVPEALTLYRRRQIDGVGDAEALARLHHAFAKAQIEYAYWPQLAQTAELPLDPAVIANLIVRGIMPAPFDLPYTPPSGVGNVATFPQSTLDAAREASASGVDVDRLFGMVAAIGRPMSPVDAAQATFRTILQHDDYLRAVLESDVRGEWADAIFERARQIPTAHDFVEKRLRGWTDDQGMFDGTALHGMSQADTETLFLISGRPITPHQVFVGLLRGGIYDGPTDVIDPPFLKALQESNIRPEWYNLLWASRYGFPPLFQLNNLVKAGAVPPATAKQWVTWEAYAPEVVDTLTTYWEGVYPGAGGTTAAVKPDPAVTAARSAAVTEIRKAFTAGGISELSARQDLADLGVPAGAIDRVIADWNVIVAVGTQEADTAGGTPH